MQCLDVLVSSKNGYLKSQTISEELNKLCLESFFLVNMILKDIFTIKFVNKTTRGGGGGLP
jgi:hypothetical protein